MSHSPSARVVIPVKAFARAKMRLSSSMDPDLRASLARAMADLVVAAAAPLPVSVVCDDDDVAAWAVSVGAEVEWTPELGLNGAVQEATRRLHLSGVERVVVAHADLPFARDLAALAQAEPDEALVVADRRGQGTNVLSLPTAVPFTFAYGAGSFPRHLAEAAAHGLRVRVIDSERLGWDVDEPGDLQVPAHLGAGSSLVTNGVLSGRSRSDAAPTHPEPAPHPGPAAQPEPAVHTEPA